MEQQIRHFKLLNGDDVIAFLVNNNEDSYIIEEPLLLVQNMTGNYNFTKWFPLSPQKAFKLYKTRVMQHVPVFANISDAYCKYLMVSDSDDEPRVQTYKELLSEMVKQEINMRTDQDYSDEDYMPVPDDIEDDDPTIH